MKRFFLYLLVAGAVILAWQAWHPAPLVHRAMEVRYSIPNIAPEDGGLWRVVTRRMVWKKAATSMRQQLHDLGYGISKVQKREPVELYAFDDPEVFTKKSTAYQRKTWWEAHGVDADVLELKSDGKVRHYRVELGRYYMRAYAQEAEKHLKASGRVYRYQKRQVVIPTYRFAFLAMSKSEAEIVWKRLQNLGIADPVMLRQEKFNELYANKSAKRSNK